jgi:hypothetical protein
MIEHLNDPDKILMTESVIIPDIPEKRIEQNFFAGLCISKPGKHLTAHLRKEQIRGFCSFHSKAFPGQLDFRVAETPCFCAKKNFTKKKSQASEEIINTLLSPDFKEKTDRAVPEDQNVPGENAHTSFLAIDYAICKNESGELNPAIN